MDFSFMSKLKGFNLDLGSIELPKIDFPKILWDKMPEMKIGDCSASLPIVQGGMGVGISLSGLASAVADAGGVGVIAANAIGMLDADYSASHKDGNSIALRREIRKAREKTSGILGVNIMVAVNDFDSLLRVAIEEKIDVVFLGAGLPIKGIPVAELRGAGVKVVPIVSSARAAGLIFRAWDSKYQDIPDGVVVEGPKAGGHLGFKEDQIDNPAFALECILPDVVSEIKPYRAKFGRSIPVIGAGGVFTGADIHNLFRLGASGVQMGTRFVATHECDADIRFKEAYLACREGDVEIIRSPVGMPGRAIKSRFLADVSSGKRPSLKCSWKCLKSCDTKSAHYCISLALDNARRGLLEKGFVFAGSNVFRVDKIVAVRELLQELQDQYRLAAQRGATSLRTEYERALERLMGLKEEYVAAVKNALAPVMEEYERGIEKGAAAFREECVKAVEKTAAVKADYQNTLAKADCLKEELIEILERHSLFYSRQPSPA